MINFIFGLLCIIGLIFGLYFGRVPDIGKAVLEGGGNAVKLTISLLGMMGLWGGIMRVAEKSGAAGFIAKFMKPFLKLLFPDACKKKNGLSELAAALTANLLGMGNAATPLALKAMEKLKENAPDNELTPDMAVFCTVSCSPFTLIPATLITLRSAGGSSNPAEIIVPVWIVSAASAVFAGVLSRLLTFCKVKR